MSRLNDYATHHVAWAQREDRLLPFFPRQPLEWAGPSAQTAGPGR